MESILSFIRNSFAELTSLTLSGIRCSPQHLIDLSTLIPMVAELDLYGIGGDSMQLLTIKSDSPHNILFPRLERLVIRHHPNPHSDPELPYCSDMFHSRLYLATNTAIIENMSPLQHAELRLGSLVDCGLLEFDRLDRPNKHDLQRLIRSLRSVYLATIGLNKKTSHRQQSLTKEARIHGTNRYIFPAQHELGYCAARLPTGETIRFFRKLDAAFTALEGYPVTHALEILVCIVLRQMHIALILRLR
ncbi:hypothetical protein BD779DRAFT_1582012 [Infundibulicybe gibba]|nr:hypothetical protein BD779DRAFT_1582012 [Infundibulicybe gibba]